MLGTTSREASCSFSISKGYFCSPYKMTEEISGIFVLFLCEFYTVVLRRLDDFYILVGRVAFEC